MDCMDTSFSLNLQRVLQERPGEPHRADKAVLKKAATLRESSRQDFAEL
jgi:hypothetical protein